MLRLKVYFSYVLGVSQCFVWGLVFLSLRVSFLTFWVYSVLCWEVSFFYVWG